MISRWWLVPLDLAFGGRLGAMFAARDAFFAVREGQRAARAQRRFDEARRAVSGALRDPAARRALEDELLRRYERR